MSSNDAARNEVWVEESPLCEQVIASLIELVSRSIAMERRSARSRLG